MYKKNIYIIYSCCKTSVLKVVFEKKVHFFSCMIIMFL